jgi:hypothetical protein
MKRIFFLLTLLGAIASMSACSNNDRRVNAEEAHAVYATTRLIPDAPTGVKNYLGPNMNTMGEQNTYQMYSLESSTKQPGATSYRLVVLLTYFTKWRYYDSAMLENVPATTFKVISREEGVCDDRGCLFKELMAIELTPEFMTQNSKKGFQIEIKAKTGDTNVLYVPGPYIQGFMAAVTGKKI